MDEFKYIKIGLLSYYFQLSEWNYPRNKGMPFKAVNNGLITFPLLRLPMLRKRRYWSWPLACNKQFFTYLFKKNLLISKMSGKSKCNIVQHSNLRMGCTCEVLTAVLQLILKYACHIIITFFVSMFCQSDSVKKTDG